MTQAYDPNRITGMYRRVNTGFDGTNYYLQHVDSEGMPYAKNKVWDTGTLAWVSMTQSVVKTDTLTVTSTTDLTKIGGTAVGLANPLFVSDINSRNEALIVYVDGDVLYVCKAPIGTALASAAWQIKKVDTTTGVVMQFCDGNALYDNVATSLAVVKLLSFS